MSALEEVKTNFGTHARGFRGKVLAGNPGVRICVTSRGRTMEKEIS